MPFRSASQVKVDSFAPFPGLEGAYKGLLNELSLRDGISREVSLCGGGTTISTETGAELYVQ